MSLALHYWMGDVHHCSGPRVSEMTYTVSSGTLNSTIPIPYRYHAEFGRSKSNRMGVHRKVPKNWGTLEPRPCN